MCSYCGCRNIPMIAKLNAEHDQLDADLEAIDAGDLTRIPTMIALLNNHIDREENGLFPAALAYLDDTQWDTIQRPELMNGPEAAHPHPH